MLVLSALIVPCGLLVLMMAMQQVQERLLPPGGPVLSLADTADVTGIADVVDIAAQGEAAAVGDIDVRPAAIAVEHPPLVVLIPAQATYEPSESVVGSASLTSASPSR